MDIKILYEDNDVLVVDKPAGIVVFPEGQTTGGTLIDSLIEQYPALTRAGEAPRYGIVHRLDKDTSGILLVAKSTEVLIFLQKQFKNRGVEKKYTALSTGLFKDNFGTINGFIGRSKSDPRKQKAYSNNGTVPPGAREAITEYTVVQRFNEYALLEVVIKTGRKHQIRCHLASIHHPIAGDKIYSFKDSPVPQGLSRQFLHASYLKVILPIGVEKEFQSELPEELQIILKNIKSIFRISIF